MLKESIKIPSGDEPLFLFVWNGFAKDQITEIHSLETLKAQYGVTNLYEEEECPITDRDRAAGDWVTFAEALRRSIDGDNFQEWNFDNMWFKRIF